MLSQKTRYAIRAMQHLADHYGKGPVQLADIAEAQKIPPKFLTELHMSSPVIALLQSRVSSYLRGNMKFRLSR